jgi:HEPN domain-containing protein
MAACDEARRLLAKAGEDEYVLDRLLGDAAAPEAVVGFHAQQAAEKLLKAALFLADLAASSGLNLPAECEALRWLTPYAVLYRYEGDADEDEERLARQEVRENLRKLRGWVEARLAADEKPGHG